MTYTAFEPLSSPLQSKNMKKDDILNLAASNGLQLKEDMSFNEMGIDFRVVFARDLKDQTWVLRIPRRENLDNQIKQEKKILDLVKKHLSISVPDWKISNPNLIAYPLLENNPIITFDPSTYEITWNIDQKENQIVSSLAQVLCKLHQIPVSEATASGIRLLTIQQVRQEIFDSIEEVKREIGISIELENRWRRWIDTDIFWPDFSTFVHGDLYAGHILSDTKGRITGIIDWSEAQVSDPSIDFSGHLAVFGEQSLKDLICRYEECGGKVWKNMFEHSRERHLASALKYAIFALKTNIDEHIDSAKIQLGIIQ